MKLQNGEIVRQIVGRKYKYGKKVQKNIKIREMEAVCEANPAYNPFIYTVWSTMFILIIGLCSMERHWCQNRY